MKHHEPGAPLDVVRIALRVSMCFVLGITAKQRSDISHHRLVDIAQDANKLALQANGGKCLLLIILMSLNCRKLTVPCEFANIKIAKGYSRRFNRGMIRIGEGWGCCSLLDFSLSAKHTFSNYQVIL